MTYFPNLIKKEFGSISRDLTENNILTSGYYLVCQKLWFIMKNKTSDNKKIKFHFQRFEFKYQLPIHTIEGMIPEF